ncbi:MAG: hypothetical protein Q7T70_06630, partial [Polaromonas sp.]|nr:hypothetical protein [Polaromonas sp.]
GGVVRRLAKWAATLSMSGSALILWWTFPKRWIALAVIAVMACVLIWLWQRPEKLADSVPPPS